MGNDGGSGAAPTVARGAARHRVFGETGAQPDVGDGGDAALVRI